jgi:uncharacterized protein
MKFAEAHIDGAHLIQGYEFGRIFIGARTYRQGLIVSPERIVTGWGPGCAADLAREHFEALLELDPQVIIVGTGENQFFPDPRTYLATSRLGFGIEFMDTGAACRTYNILVSEGRKVVAGLIIC